MIKKLWFICAAISVLGLLFGLWVLPSSTQNPAGGAGLLITLVVLVPLSLVTMHRLRKKAFKVE